ncbi:MAG: VC_2705 family sodium/solute symporter [Burkholderiales bacterium]|nr:VC_2705 family sodium/solute symporter [Burkholderiales bacterium]
MVSPVRGHGLTGVLRRWLTLRSILLLVWFIASFGVMFFAHDLQQVVAGWPFSFWFASQGALIVFTVITALFAWVTNRRDGRQLPGQDALAYSGHKRRLHRLFAYYVLGLLVFLGLLSLAEYWGLSRNWIGAIFLFVTVGLYAVIGVYNRTTVASEYYVAGRRVPAVYNGMATAADWMSAASFISLAGGLYLQGFSGSESQTGGLAYVLGWTGGFCLVALLVAPHLRERGLYTVPDFFDQRFAGVWPRRIAALAAVLCSFTYVVAQIYGVGLISSRLTGVHFEIGILLGLGGVLVCSFLGGMRAVTWTQVAQYVILILAFMIPVSWLAYKQLGNPLAPLVYGQQLAKISEMEKQLAASPAEQEVIQEYARRARDYERKLLNVEVSLQEERAWLKERLRLLMESRTDAESITSVRREIAMLPKDAQAAREVWTRAMQENLSRAKPLGGMPTHVQPFAGDPLGTPQERQAFETSRLNFLALMFCLMIGTAGMPHLLTRYFTTPSVAEARSSVGWSLFFICLLYVSAPALAVLVKFEVMSHLVGQRFDDLPAWMLQWARVDSSLLSISDVNRDNLLQFSELKLGADIVMLAMPELGGLPYVISGLVAAGGLAAALSTADGLLLTIGNAISHDIYRRGDEGDRVNEMRRVILSKFTLMVAALAAAYVAALKPADILNMVSASFSLAGSAFVPAMVLGIFWRRTSRQAAVAGMLTGVGVTVYYMLVNASSVRAALGLVESGLWFGIQPISAGVFGVAAGFAVTVLVSLISRREPPEAAPRPDGL